MAAPSVLHRHPVFGATVLALSLARPAAAGVCVEAHVRSTGLPLNPVILTAMMNEASAIWAPYAVAIRWTDGRANSDRCQPADSAVAVQVDNTPSRSSTARPLTLGTTRLSGPGPVPIRVDYAAIDRLVGSLPADKIGHVVGRQQLAPSDVGRALGRVLAHEVGHVLLAGSGHRRSGLMRASFVPAELIDYRRRAYALSSAEIARIADRGLGKPTAAAAITED